MNRRDIIIVAVLINAGLLATLFVTSLNKNPSGELASKTCQPTPTAVAIEVKPQEKDQIDQVISQYTAQVQVEEKKEDVLPAPVFVPTPKVETPPPLPQSSQKVVTVEKGDVLGKIAQSHGVSIDEIMKLNHLSNSRLQVGQELKLPDRKAPKKEAPLVKKEEGKYYVVKGGDSPWTIAQKNGIQVDELLRLNNLDEEKAKRLRPGDRLRIQ